MDFLSRSEVLKGNAVDAAEKLVESQRRTELARGAIEEAWKEIIGKPDELLVDLVAETAERISGFKPDSDLVGEFLDRHVAERHSWTPLVAPPSKGPRRQSAEAAQPSERRRMRDHTQAGDEPSTQSRKQEGRLPLLTREQLKALPDGQLALYPSHPDGVDFLVTNNAWGFIRLRCLDTLRE